MDELRETHLGILSARKRKPGSTVTERLQAAYAAVVAKRAKTAVQG